MTNIAAIETNLRSVKERMRAACERASRSPDDVTLVAVTKTVGVPEMEALVRLGATHLGENRVQDAARKFPCMRCPGAVTAHMIGHLQRNKVKQAIGLFNVIHSVDSSRLLKELEKVAAKAGIVVPVFVQVNVAEEPQKYGVLVSEVEELARKAYECRNVRLVGLMTMAPLVRDAESVRPIFRKLRELRDELAPDFPGLEKLSMGMTQDFEVAIEEGATDVRIGSALFAGLYD